MQLNLVALIQLDMLLQPDNNLQWNSWSGKNVPIYNWIFCHSWTYLMEQACMIQLFFSSIQRILHSSSIFTYS